MNLYRRGALPGVLMLATLSGACQDAPLGPRAPAARGAPDAGMPYQRSFAGRSSDSLVEFVTSAWARHGHPEYRQAIDAWRQRVLGTTQPGILADAVDRRASPPMFILDDGSGTVQAPPQVQTHQEAFIFGHTGDFTVPSVLEGEMTFVGDVGTIAAGSFAVTSTAGTNYSVSGQLASGAGQLITCQDISLDCASSKRLSGSISVTNAPFCNASAKGNVLYSAQNIQSSYGTIVTPLLSDGTGGTSTESAGTSAFVQSQAPSCGTTTSDAGDTGGGGYSDPEDTGDTAWTPSDPYVEPTPPPNETGNGCTSYYYPVLMMTVVVCPAE